MNSYAFHPEAFADLVEIWEYIAEDNIDAADLVIADVFHAIRGLLAFPYQGHGERTSQHALCVSYSCGIT